MEPGGSRGFAGLPDFCPETCLQPARPSARQAGRRCGAVSSGGIDDVFSACLGLQTDFWFEVMLGTPTGLAVSQSKIFPKAHFIGLGNFSKIQSFFAKRQKRPRKTRVDFDIGFCAIAMATHGNLG